MLAFRRSSPSAVLQNLGNVANSHKRSEARLQSADADQSAMVRPSRVMLPLRIAEARQQRACPIFRSFIAGRASGRIHVLNRESWIHQFSHTATCTRLERRRLVSPTEQSRLSRDPHVRQSRPPSLRQSRRTLVARPTVTHCDQFSSRNEYKGVRKARELAQCVRTSNTTTWHLSEAADVALVRS